MRCAADVILGVQGGSLTLRWPENAPMAGPIIELGRRCLRFDPDDRPRFEVIVEELVGIERRIRAELLAPQLLGNQADNQANLEPVDSDAIDELIESRPGASSTLAYLS